MFFKLKHMVKLSLLVFKTRSHVAQAGLKLSM